VELVIDVTSDGGTRRPVLAWSVQVQGPLLVPAAPLASCSEEATAAALAVMTVEVGLGILIYLWKINGTRYY